jgi:hypothetical protein
MYTNAMKQVVFVAAISCALGAAIYAGPEQYSGKEMKQAVAPAPCPEWYADNEWNVSVWGTYAFTGTDDNQRIQLEDFFMGDQGTFDRYLGDDHAWGGGLDVKYFFHRYFGLGLEGWAVDARRRRLDISGFDEQLFVDNTKTENRVVGSILGTLTLRYPFHCSRFSPYAFAGGGAIFGGGERDRVIGIIPGRLPGNFSTAHDDGTTELIGQFGGGLEVRFTPHIGWINDFSWNVVNGPRNNFGMVRSGINFAF